MNASYQKHYPMIATYSRIFAAVPLMVLLSMGTPWSQWPAAIVFIIASLTDWLDGYLARKYNAESAMGKFMDPIADKIIVLVALIMLLHLDRVGPVMVTILIARDIYIGGLRSVAAANQVIIAAKPFGKYKTAIQMVTIPCLFVFEPRLFFNIPIQEIGYWGLWISVVLSLISGIQYTFGYYKNK
ncbi:MAG: CDP-diacylglycerol--glycerol-3-phosphate 3-phosphatidyltransferase [Bdellovibrionaceae bacterium]|nr:CDP-diacylglycerol--glycerol-3-phosphate 3-phosphatidyltransferase [Pseudobdellovibrionaceae bacterium]